MLQFYFLSILSNFIAGTALCADALARRLRSFAALAAVLSSRKGKLSIGLAALLVGFGTLFVPASGPLVLGDLLPAMSGMTMGIALLFEVFRQDALFPSEPPGSKERPSFSYRATLGVLGIAAAVLHFFLPERPFL